MHAISAPAGRGSSLLADATRTIGASPDARATGRTAASGHASAAAPPPTLVRLPPLCAAAVRQPGGIDMTEQGQPVDRAVGDAFAERWHAAWNAHDPARVAELCTPDIVLE